MSRDSRPSLCANDRAVLNSIFNPLLPTGDVLDEKDIPDELNETEVETDEVLKSRELELDAVKKAEAGKFEESLTLFNEAIEVAPQRASGYNNRGQLLRLKGDIHGAIKDLDKAIELSGGKGKSACQAYTQRGLIHRFEGDDDAARRDFTQAAELGSEFAKSQLIQMNPYAALCNKMLAQAFGKLQRGERDEGKN